MYRYRVKLRAERFLWGSAGVTTELKWPIFLTTRVDELGEEITLGTVAPGGARTTCAKLQPGETYTIVLQNVIGVFATCATDTQLTCVLSLPHLGPT